MAQTSKHPSQNLTPDQLYQIFKEEDKNEDGILKESELFSALQKLDMMTLEWCQKFSEIKKIRFSDFKDVILQDMDYH